MQPMPSEPLSNALATLDFSWRRESANRFRLTDIQWRADALLGLRERAYWQHLKPVDGRFECRGQGDTLDGFQYAILLLQC